jgi:hypothetical protein
MLKLGFGGLAVLAACAVLAIGVPAVMAGPPVIATVGGLQPPLPLHTPPGGPPRVVGSTPVFPEVPPGGFPHAGYVPGNCTWWVAHNRLVPGSLGDAWQWLGDAAVAGFATSAQPALGAVVVYKREGGYSSLGHVAIVIAISATDFTVSEMNYLGLGIVDERESPWPDPAHVEGFIL